MKTDDCIAVAGVGAGIVLIGFIDHEPITWADGGIVVILSALCGLFLRWISR